MSNFANTSDLKKFVLQCAGELDDGTSEFDAKAIEMLDRAHKAMLSGGAELGIDVGQPWPWAVNKYPKILTLLPAVKNLLVTVTNNSTAITFGSAPLVNLQDYIIQIQNFPECYRISSHVGLSTSATLDAIYVNESSTGVPCVISKIDYDLDQNILRLVAPFKTYRNTGYYATYADVSPNIDMIDDAEFGRTYPVGNMIEGTPDKFAQIYKSNDTMQPRIRINRVPDQILRAEYNYVPVPVALTDSTSSIPLVPLDHRITLGYYAAYFLNLDKQDNKAAEYRELARAGIMAMKRAAQVEKINSGSNYGKMIPRMDLVNQNKKIWGGTY